jgi:hypothetical protein
MMSKNKPHGQIQYKELYKQVANILLKHDPVGIASVDSHEYDPEVSAILPQLKSCQSEKDVLEMVYSEFVKWFDKTTAGPKSKYNPIAKEIWEIRCE